MPEFYVNSNLTPREAFSVHGTLPDSMIEKIIDENEVASGIDYNTPICDAVESIRLAEALVEAMQEDYDSEGEISTCDFEKLTTLLSKAQTELKGDK